MTDEDLYEARLAERVEQWSSKHPDDAQTMRNDVQRRNGIIRRPEPGGLVAMMLERLYREQVRQLKRWPTLREWAKK